jgi:hypothetical protein
MTGDHDVDACALLLPYVAWCSTLVSYARSRRRRCRSERVAVARSLCRARAARAGHRSGLACMLWEIVWNEWFAVA